MTFTLQILIASSVFCIVIITLLIIQKIGYLKHKIFTVLMLFASMLFLVAATTLFYCEYSVYTRDKNLNERIIAKNLEQKKHQKELSFNALEVDVLEEFNDAKNRLIGYENFMIESAQNYNPENYSYKGLLEEEIIAKFQAKEYNLEYWKEINTILNSIYTGQNPYDIKENTPYYPITIVPAKHEINNQFEWQEDIEFNKSEDIEYKGKILYLQRKIKNFDRSSESILELWKNNKMFIYTIISKSTYDSMSKMVDDLITIYDRIIQEPNYREFYAEHNIFIDENENQGIDYDNEVFLSFPTKEFVDSFDDYWGFGFWDRRIEEDNDKVVYQILKEIQAHYKD